MVEPAFDHRIAPPGPFFLVSMARQEGHLPWSRAPLFLIYLTKTALALPFQIVERYRALKDNSKPLDVEPVFILGYFRSGTTYLQKLMLSDSRFGFISLLDVYFPYTPRFLLRILKSLLQRLIGTFRIPDPWFNDRILDLGSPHEEDAWMASAGWPCSAYWTYVFPKTGIRHLGQYIPGDAEHRREWQIFYNRLIRKLSNAQGKKHLLLRSPPNTGRVKALLEMFPRARFVFIHREVHPLFSSMYNLMEKVIEKHFTLQKIEKPEREDLIFTSYRMLMQEYLWNRGAIPEGRLVEVRYEDLLNAPSEIIEHIYLRLGLTLDTETRRNLDMVVQRESSYRPREHSIDPITAGKIDTFWGDLAAWFKHIRPADMTSEARGGAP
jgi:hypothetical protein